MGYLSVKEAAEKWGMSPRYVQRLCNEGRIEGVLKDGQRWVIPQDAARPEGKRPTPEVSQNGIFNGRKTENFEDFLRANEGEPSENGENEGFTRSNDERERNGTVRTAMPLINTAYAPGHAREAVEAIEDEGTKRIAKAELCYFSGRSAEASDIAEEFLTHKDLALRMSACLLYAYSNLALDRIPRARQALTQIRTSAEELDESTPLIYKAYTVFVSTCANVLLHLPQAENAIPIKRAIHVLPAGLRIFALYAEAHQSYLDGKYGSCIGMAEAALALEAEKYPIATIYLHLVATMGYVNLKQMDKAREHLLRAWEIAQPDDMIEAFGEHHGLLGGLLEIVIKKDYPDDFRRMIDITYSFSAGWRKIHNPYTGHFVADDLSTTEFTIAMLAARGWSNKEIAEHLDLKTNTVKMHVSIVLQKLGITQRTDLTQFMLK